MKNVDTVMQPTGAALMRGMTIDEESHAIEMAIQEMRGQVVLMEEAS